MNQSMTADVREIRKADRTATTQHVLYITKCYDENEQRYNSKDVFSQKWADIIALHVFNSSSLPFSSMP